jgi:hypothetical protein
VRACVRACVRPPPAGADLSARSPLSIPRSPPGTAHRYDSLAALAGWLQLCVEELRQAQELGAGRIAVHHTLTDFGRPGDSGDDDAVTGGGGGGGGNDYWLPGRHYHFTSQWNPYVPPSGELRTGAGEEEASLRGRVDGPMLRAVLPPPGEGVRVAVCGPPAMWGDMQRALVKLGHAPEALVELKALTDEQQEVYDLRANKRSGTANKRSGTEEEAAAAWVGPLQGVYALVRRWLGHRPADALAKL